MTVYLPTLRVPAQSPDVAFPETNLLTYQEVQNIKSRAVAYVAAEFSDENFPANGQFTIGGRGQTSDYPNNKDLTAGEFYTFFLRAFPKLSSTQKRQTVSPRNLTAIEVNSCIHRAPPIDSTLSTLPVTTALPCNPVCCTLNNTVTPQHLPNTASKF